MHSSEVFYNVNPYSGQTELQSQSIHKYTTKHTYFSDWILTSRRPPQAHDESHIHTLFRVKTQMTGAQVKSWGQRQGRDRKEGTSRGLLIMDMTQQSPSQHSSHSLALTQSSRSKCNMCLRTYLEQDNKAT